MLIIMFRCSTWCSELWTAFFRACVGTKVHPNNTSWNALSLTQSWNKQRARFFFALGRPAQQTAAYRRDFVEWPHFGMLWLWRSSDGTLACFQRIQIPKQVCEECLSDAMTGRVPLKWVKNSARKERFFDYISGISLVLYISSMPILHFRVWLECLSLKILCVSLGTVLEQLHFG